MRAEVGACDDLAEDVGLARRGLTPGLGRLGPVAAVALARRDPARRRARRPGVVVGGGLAAEGDGLDHPAFEIVVGRLRPQNAVGMFDALAQAVVDIGVDPLRRPAGIGIGAVSRGMGGLDQPIVAVIAVAGDIARAGLGGWRVNLARPGPER